MRHTRTVLACVAAASATLAVAAQPSVAGGQGTVVNHGALSTLNDSGVTGTVTILEKQGHLRANLDAEGLEPMQLHMQHIHGFADGVQATCPDLSLAGADGILSFAEGLPKYGPVKVTLGHDHPEGSALEYSRTFAATDAGAAVSSLGDIDQYVVVVHGLTVNGAYDPSTPVACAVLGVSGR